MVLVVDEPWIVEEMLEAFEYLGEVAIGAENIDSATALLEGHDDIISYSPIYECRAAVVGTSSTACRPMRKSTKIRRYYRTWTSTRTTPIVEAKGAPTS